jgi:outer membrane protein OmpA-like peptidoglycan-associated protein
LFGENQMHTTIKIALKLIVFVSLFNLTGCWHQTGTAIDYFVVRTTPVLSVDGRKEPIALEKLFSCCEWNRMTLVQRLDAYGVKVIQFGEQVKIIFPTDLAFCPNSSKINPNFFQAINYTILFLRTFQKITVMVEAFTDDSLPYDFAMRLSDAQAYEIRTYLSDIGVGARLMISRGYGPNKPIALPITQKGCYQNRRIEISFHLIDP